MTTELRDKLAADAMWLRADSAYLAALAAKERGDGSAARTAATVSMARLEMARRLAWPEA